MSWIITIGAAPIAGVNNQIPTRLVTKEGEDVGILMNARTIEERVIKERDTTIYEYFSDLKYAMADGVNLQSLHYVDRASKVRPLPDDWHSVLTIAGKVF